MAKITDLTNTTWVIPVGWSATAGYGRFSINAKVAWDNYGTYPYNIKSFNIGYYYDLTSKANSIAVYYETWDNIFDIPPNNSITELTIEGGADVTNPSLISWLEANGECQNPPAPTVIITYNNTEITSLTEGQTATVPAGKKATSDISIVFGAKGSIIYNGQTTEVEAGKTATLVCAGKKFVTDVVVAVEKAKGYTVTAASNVNNTTYDPHFASAKLADGSQVSITNSDVITEAVEVTFDSGWGEVQIIYRMPPTDPQTLIEISEDTTVPLTADMLIEHHSANYCILGDSVITMADDTIKEFKDIVVGDEVKFYDLEQKQWRPAVVTWFHMVHPNGALEDNTLSKQLFYNEYTFEDGTIIKTAMRHRFYNVEQQAFVYMPLWNIGEHALKADGTEIALVSARRVEVDTPITYCQMKFEAESYVNFIANGCMTGDRRCPAPVTFE